MENTARAKLYAAQGTLLSMPQVAARIETHLWALAPGIAVRETASLAQLTLRHNSATITLFLTFDGQDTVLEVVLNDAKAHGAAAQADLARLIYHLAEDFDVAAIEWQDTGARIPADTFLRELKDTLAPSDTGRITPRRVTVSTPRSRPRRTLDTCQRSNSPMHEGHNAPVKALDMRMRDVLCRPAQKAELDTLETELGIIPLEARLSAWAVSLTIATFSLPIAAPVLIYNVLQGEDLRLASLGLGLLGLFMALNASGALAVVMGF